MIIMDLITETRRLLLMHQLYIIANENGGIGNFCRLLREIEDENDFLIFSVAKMIFMDKKIKNDHGETIAVDVDLIWCITENGKINFPRYCNALGNLFFNYDDVPPCVLSEGSSYGILASSRHSYILPLLFPTKKRIDIQIIGCKEK
jgi:hypothetical protein